MPRRCSLLGGAVAFALLAGCGGGGGSNSGGMLPATPVATPTSSQPAASASRTQNFPSSGGPYAQPLPAFDGYLGTLLLPIVSSPAGTQDTITVQTTAPHGVPKLQSLNARRGTEAYDNAAIEYVTLSFSKAARMNAFPSFQFSLPQNISTNAGEFYVAFFDPTNPVAGWQDAAIGPPKVKGQVVTFALPNPPAYSGRSIVFQPSQPYEFALYNENARLTDDWTSFQHDQQLTGFEQNDTGITPQNVGQLQLAWRAQPDRACAAAASAAQQNLVDASPLVWNGLVYYTDQCGMTVALHREDGSPAWSEDEAAYAPYVKSTLGGARGTPAIDPAREIIVVPMWGLYPAFGTCPGSSCVPDHGGYLVALNARTGAVLWRAYPPNTNGNAHAGSAIVGNLRGSPIILDGKVFMGLAGGDKDGGSTQGGVEGGLFVVNELTGQSLPEYFQIAPLGEPNDAGSSWSPISFDGQFIYFGTGNTNHADGMQDSIIQLNPQNMAAAPTFKIQTVPLSDDTDVGGGVLLWARNAYFTGKNGYYYSSSLITPQLTIRTQTNTTPNDGSYATPSTDGTIVAVPSGFNPPYKAGGLPHSYLDIFPVGSGKTACAPTSIQSTNTALFNSPAFVKGLGFIGADNNAPTGDVTSSAPAFVAFSDQCRILWHADLGPGPVGYFVGGPAVVESGVYAIDANGNVYSWKLPEMIGIQSHGRKNVQSAVGSKGPHHQSFELIMARNRNVNQ